VAPALASIDLLLLCGITLSLSLLDTPVPRAWAFAAVALLTVQSLAMHAMDQHPFEPDGRPSNALVHSFAEGVAVLAVPLFTAALLTVIFFHCARAYARAKRRLEAALRDQAIGNDMPTG
jgi:hypothetical protein